MELVTQSMGFVGLFFMVISYQFKTRRMILVCKMLGSFAFAVHFALLGSYTGAALNTIGIVGAVLFQYFDNTNRPLWPPVSMAALFVLAGILTWQGWISVLPIAGMLVGTLARWQRNPQRLRVFSLFAPPLWLTYNVLSGSIAGVINEIVNIASTLIGLWRHRQSRRFQKQQ